jgi:hypothetical protein
MNVAVGAFFMPCNKGKAKTVIGRGIDLRVSSVIFSGQQAFPDYDQHALGWQFLPPTSWGFHFPLL